MRYTAGLLIVFGAFSANAQVVVLIEGQEGYTGCADTSFFDEGPSFAGGGSTGLFSGTTRVGDIRRALIRFNLEDILPQDAVLTGASLTLTVTRARGDAPDTGFGLGNGLYRLHRLTQPWGEGNVIAPSQGGFGAPAEEGDATWASRFHPSTAWQNPGGDFDGLASAEAIAGDDGEAVTWTSEHLRDDVRQWLQDPAVNFGWIVLAASEGAAPKDVKRFGSAEHADPQLRPMLTLTFDSGAAVPADIDGDGNVTDTDVQLVINAALALPIGGLDADVDDNGSVNAADVQTVINAALGLP